MTQTTGIIIAQDGAPIEDPNPKYSSLNPTLIVDLERDPKHMQIVTTKGFRAYTDNTGNSGRLFRDVYDEIEHGLGYVPLVDCYIYALSFDGSETDVNAGRYGDQVFFFSASLGTASDIFTYEVDQKYFRLVRYFDSYISPSGYVTIASRYVLRSKFYIYSIDTGRTTMDSGYPYDGDGVPLP